MTDQRPGKAEHAALSRMICMLLNRSLMYNADHPHIKEAVSNLHQQLAGLLPRASTMALMLNKDQLYLDDEPVDPRINATRIIALFKKTGVQSISFSNGISPGELNALIDIFTSPDKFPDSDAMMEELNFRGVQYLKINHVFYKKVTRDDEIITGGGGKTDRTRPEKSVGTDPVLQKQFLEMLWGSVLTEETGKTLSLKNMMADPAGLSRSMLAAENSSMAAVEAGNIPPGSTGDADHAALDPQSITPGATLLYQIRALSDDVEKQIEEESRVDMIAVADAVFEMKRQLALGIESQKALNLAYANEGQIFDQVNELADNVIVKLVKNEYQQGAISTARLAQILRRLVPEADELKRLLPKIKTALLGEGMPLGEYLQLVRHLGKELESDGLARVFQEAAEAVGVDADELLQEMKKKPEQAAELMAIAAEIRKGGGDDKAFTEMLINYVEHLGEATGAMDAEGDAGENSAARMIMTSLKSGLSAQLQSMNFDTEALARMEERINARLEAVFEKLADGREFRVPATADPPREKKTLLQMIEQSLGKDDRLKQIMRVIRAKADSGRIDENDFNQIYAGIAQEETALHEQELKKEMPPGVLKAREFKIHLEKELFRAKRHELNMSALAFTIVKVRSQEKVPENKRIKKSELLNAAYRKLVDIVRTSDIIGELDQETMTIILPMATKDNARLALKRINKLLHDQTFEIDDISLNVIIAGSVASFRPDERPNVEAFIKMMAYELDHVAVRVKNIHNLT